MKAFIAILTFSLVISCTNKSELKHSQTRLMGTNAGINGAYAVGCLNYRAIDSSIMEVNRFNGGTLVSEAYHYKGPYCEGKAQLKETCVSGYGVGSERKNQADGWTRHEIDFKNCNSYSATPLTSERVALMSRSTDPNINLGKENWVINESQTVDVANWIRNNPPIKQTLFVSHNGDDLIQLGGTLPGATNVLSSDGKYSRISQQNGILYRLFK